MEYQVPQFIEVKDKIFGPLTLKQFVFVAGGIGLSVILILYLPTFIGVILSIPVAALTGALAFYKVNNKSFVDVLEAAFNFYTKDRLYLWKKEPHEIEAAPIAPAVERQKLELSRGRLKELAWSLDIKDRQQVGPGSAQGAPSELTQLKS